VEAAAAYFFERKHRRISIEWTMMAGVNDDPRQAEALAGIARRLRAHVNLIPLNPTPHSPERPSPRSRIDEFISRLRAAGVTVTLRDTRGRGIDAACGQLRATAG
jgi:23S rRNA (adenine2503-C2)-methyltransferase